MINFYRQSIQYMKHKENLVGIKVQTEHFEIWANPKQAETSSSKKKSHKLDHIKNNPLAVTITLLMIYQEVLPLMIYVGPITLWEFFKTFLTGSAVA